MASSSVIRTRVTDEIRQALEAYCRQQGTDLSTLIREAILTRIGRPDLIATMPSPGRPEGKPKDGAPTEGTTL